MKTYSELIAAVQSPWDNPYQGNDRKVLFCCTMGILRSATGARMYAHKYNTRAVGSHDGALIRISPDLILWADQIVFVNDANYQQALRDYDDTHLQSMIQAKAIILDIPDQHEHMHPELQKAFKEQYEPLE